MRRSGSRPELGVERVRSRVSAFVYGNVLALAAVLQSGPEEVRDGAAVVIVAATMLTTYVAHVVAHEVGESVGRDRVAHRSHVRDELRDALPIVSSGTAPGVVLLVGWLWPGGELGDGQTAVVQLVAGLVVVGRLVALGWLSGRYRQGASPRRTFFAGLALGGVGVVVALVKVLLTH